jgi:hypothetical protein
MIGGCVVAILLLTACAQADSTSARSASPSCKTRQVSPAICARSVRQPTPPPFAADSVWNRRIARDAPLSSTSSGLVNDLMGQLKTHSPWLATENFSTPVYRVGPNVPLVKVQMDAYNPKLREQMAAVPIPENAVPADDSDGRLVIHQKSTDTMWEFWRIRRESDGWHATYGGRIDGVSSSDGVVPAPLGSTASGLPLLGGLIRPDEIRAGHIDHALAFGVPRVAADKIVAPATRTDGTTEVGGIPMGTRFRLDPKLDIDKLGLPYVTTVIAKAAQRYGMVVRDTSGAVAFYGELTRGRKSPWPAILGGQTPSQLLADFPYDRLQVVAP